MSIFISYRRGDAAGHAQNLHHRLCSWFDGGSELFFDVDSIRPGEPFPQRIADAIDASAVVLVLIGPGWLEEINRRAAIPGEVDFVRLEIERALARSQVGQQIRIIPVLVGGVGMPALSGMAPPLQRSLAPLCALDAHIFQGGKQDDWEHQFERLRNLIAATPGAPRERFRTPNHGSISASHYRALAFLLLLGSTAHFLFVLDSLWPLSPRSAGYAWLLIIVIWLFVTIGFYILIRLYFWMLFMIRTRISS